VVPAVLGRFFDETEINSKSKRLTLINRDGTGDADVIGADSGSGVVDSLYAKVCVRSVNAQAKLCGS